MDDVTEKAVDTAEVVFPDRWICIRAEQVRVFQSYPAQGLPKFVAGMGEHRKQFYRKLYKEGRNLDLRDCEWVQVGFVGAEVAVVMRVPPGFIESTKPNRKRRR